MNYLARQLVTSTTDAAVLLRNRFQDSFNLPTKERMNCRSTFSGKRLAMFFGTIARSIVDLRVILSRDTMT
jgi:hypothetical protein